jgi:genome maintenance exonuclease 1
VKLFNHVTPNSKPVCELPKEEIDGRRYYTLPSGLKVPSVTTFLSSFEKASLKKWEQKVGIAEATRVRNYTTNRGKAYHTLLECYLANELEQDWLNKNIMPDLQESFYKVVPVLNRVDNIHHIETMLYSEILGLAGQCDLIAEFDGRLSIIDHKTSMKPKREEWIENYFLQETCYSLMFEELTGIKAKQLVTIINVDHESPQVFVRERKDYVQLLAEKLQTFRNGTGQEI